MARVATEIKEQILLLRTQGCTYKEIQDAVGYPVPKGTLSYICRNITLTPTQTDRVRQIMLEASAKNRLKAVEANRQLLAAKIKQYQTTNSHIGAFMSDQRAQFVALAMLYLGEGAKWQGRRGPALASSDPDILRLYIALLRSCYDIPLDKLRCRVQHRADQNTNELTAYWSSVTGVTLQNFYLSYVDKRTIGHKTMKEGYSNRGYTTKLLPLLC